MLNTTLSLPLVLPDPHELTFAEEDNVANILLTGLRLFAGQGWTMLLQTVHGRLHHGCTRGESRARSCEPYMVLMGELRAVLNTTGDMMHTIW